MLEAMIDRLSNKVSPPDMTLDTIEMLDYRKRSFQSTLFRLQSLDKRMSNVIQLSFNTGTQEAYMQSKEAYVQSLRLMLDSRAMKGIAAMTLVFLPVTGVASVFSTPFFQVDTEIDNVKVGNNFWVFWAFVVPLTCTVLLVYRVWYTWDKASTTTERLLGWAAPLVRVDRHSSSKEQGDVESGQFYIRR
jgi:hypothetical protein